MDKEKNEQIDPELEAAKKKQADDLKRSFAQQRARGGIPIPGPTKPMNEMQAIADTVMKNAQDIHQLQQQFGQFAQQTEQTVMITQRAVQNLARPDLILGPVIDNWHNSPHSHMILMVKEGMRIVAVGEIVSMDIDPIELKSEQGIILIKQKYVLMIYKKEEGVLYGHARRNSEIATQSAEKGSDESKDSSVEAKKS